MLYLLLPHSNCNFGCTSFWTITLLALVGNIHHIPVYHHEMGISPSFLGRFRFFLQVIFPKTSRFLGDFLKFPWVLQVSFVLFSLLWRPPWRVRRWLSWLDVTGMSLSWVLLEMSSRSACFAPFNALKVLRQWLISWWSSITSSLLPATCCRWIHRPPPARASQPAVD